MFKRIALNYFPSTIAISENENYISLGTKEGIILFITRKENSLQSGFNLDIFPGHFDSVQSVKFNFNNNMLFSSSHSELLIWDIN
jgi:hypothetical protein